MEVSSYGALQCNSIVLLKNVIHSASEEVCIAIPSPLPACLPVTHLPSALLPRMITRLFHVIAAYYSTPGIHTRMLLYLWIYYGPCVAFSLY